MNRSWMATKRGGRKQSALTVLHEYSDMCRQFSHQKIFSSVPVNLKQQHLRRSTTLPDAGSDSFLWGFWRRFTQLGPVAGNSSAVRSRVFLMSPPNGGGVITEHARASMIVPRKL